MREMERQSHDRGNQYVAKDQRGPQPKSEFAEAKESAHISDTQAKRWQKRKPPRGYGGGSHRM